MKIKSINIIDGKNKWSESKDKLIHMVLDLGVYENKPSDKIEGFYEKIKEYLPSLKSHRCSKGKPGGFLIRIKDGTWMGHIIEHVALELQTLAGMNTGWGRTRGVKGQKGVYNVVFNYENEDIGKLAAREAFNVVTDIINDRDPQIDRIVKKLKPKKNLQESIRRVLRENRKLSNFLRRRLGMLDYEVEYNFYEIKNRVGTYSGIDICVIYDSGVKLFESIMENSIDAMYYNYFSHIDDNSGEWAHVYLDMVDYIRNKYQHKIMKYYDDNCGSGSIPLKESIRKVLREESTQDSLESIKIELQSMVKNIGWELTAKIVNGPKNLIKLAFNNNPMEFLNLFNDLNVVQSREEFYWSLFRYKKRNNLMIYDRKNNSLNVSKKIFWSFLEEGFGLNHSKIRELMRIWLYDTYNLNGDRTFELIPVFDWEKSSLSRMG